MSRPAFLPMHLRMVSQKARIARWAAFALLVALFVWYRVEDPGMPDPTKPQAAKRVKEPVAPPEQQAAARALVKLAREGAPVKRQRDELRKYLRESGVTAPSIRTVFRHTRDGIALWPGKAGARTRLGGQPVLPRGAEWPMNSKDLPFRFIGAFDFAELPRMKPLPSAGTLALYWDFDGDLDFVAATRTYFIPPGTPADSPDAPEATFPISEKPLQGKRQPISGDPNLVADELEERPDAKKVFAAMNELRRQGSYPHHLLGAPIEVQGPVLDRIPAFFDPKRELLSDASRSRYTPAERESADEWMLLAQIEEQDDFVIADGGVLYLVIPRADLEARRFDRVIAIMDSH